MGKQTRDCPLMKLAGERSENARGQAARFISQAQPYRNEVIAKARKRSGKRSKAIHLGRPQLRGRIVNGRFRWEKVG